MNDSLPAIISMGRAISLADLEGLIRAGLEADEVASSAYVALTLVHNYDLYGTSWDGYCQERHGISRSTSRRWLRFGQAMIDSLARGETPPASQRQVEAKRAGKRAARGALSVSPSAPPLSPSPNGATATIPTTATAVQPISTPTLDAVFPVVSNGSNGSGTHPVESLLALSARATAKEATYDLGRARSKALTAWLGEYNAAVAALKAKGPMAPESACPHPKATERHVGYGVLCGTCGAKVRLALLDALDPDDAMTALQAIPDGWAKVRGKWRQIRPSSPFTKAGHGQNCWYRHGGPCDCTANRRGYYVLVPGESDGCK